MVFIYMYTKGSKGVYHNSANGILISYYFEKMDNLVSILYSKWGIFFVNNWKFVELENSFTQ